MEKKELKQEDLDKVTGGRENDDRPRCAACGAGLSSYVIVDGKYYCKTCSKKRRPDLC